MALCSSALACVLRFDIIIIHSTPKSRVLKVPVITQDVRKLPKQITDAEYPISDKQIK